MEAIKELLMNNLLTVGILATALTALLGLTIRFLPNLMRGTVGLTGESGELLTVIAEACKDGKITKEELDAIIKEARDIRDLIRKLKAKPATETK